MKAWLVTLLFQDSFKGTTGAFVCVQMAKEKGTAVGETTLRFKAKEENKNCAITSIHADDITEAVIGMAKIIAEILDKESE